MVIAFTIETVVLGFVLLLLAGLLRSHAEILRELRMSPTGEREPEPREAAQPLDELAPPPKEEEGRPPRPAGQPAADVVGETLRGEPSTISLAGASAGDTPGTLLAFMSSGCLTCHALWSELRDGWSPELPHDGRVVVVTKSRDEESPARLRELEPSVVPLVMSSQAWSDFDVPSSPYFVYVDGASGTIAGEGAAKSWTQVVSLVTDAFADEELLAEGGALDPVRRGDRTARIDADLAAGGVFPDDPSLYSGSEPGQPVEGSVT